ncbi:MAG: response regulator [Leptospiraceae bacterium]|nr:response regulator [Leptospiraceae bacterium]MCP5512167.1 response regulator [Leptospiraceae bacterium]
MNNLEMITILYIDDESINTFLFKSIFEKQFDVIIGCSAKEGLEIMNTEGKKIDIVISDFLMPEMNGIEFIRLANSKYPDIHYYILSAYEKNNEISEALETKLIDDYFSKPFKSKIIKEAIANRKSKVL